MASVIVKTVLAGGIEFRLTEKGAVSLYNAAGGRYIDTLKPSTVRAMADSGHPTCQELMNSPEMDNIQKNWALNKEKAKVEKQAQSLLQKAQKFQQAADDILKAAGYTKVG